MDTRRHDPLRVLHVIASADPRRGGPIEGVRQLAKAGRAWGQSTDVVTFDAPGRPYLDGNPFATIPLGPSPLKYGYTPRLLPWLRQHVANYDVVVVNGLWQFNGLAVHRVCRPRSIPYFVFPHGMLDPWFKDAYPVKHAKKLLYWALIERFVLRDAASVCFTCQEEFSLGQHTFPGLQANSVVTGYGTEGPVGDPQRSVAAFFEAFPHLRGKRPILFLGRLHEKKGCDLAIQAFAAIAARDPSLELVMGGPADEALQSALARLGEQLGVAARITWTGMLSGERKWGALYAAQLFVLPSHQENFGIAVVEALACGTPVAISNKVNIWREIAGGNAGWVAADTVEGTVANLNAWLALNTRDQERARLSARQCFSHNFDIKTVVARFHETIMAKVRR